MPDFPWPLAGLAPGMGFEELYAGGYYTCRYDPGEVTSSCFVLGHRLGPDSIRVALRVTMDRRTGTVLDITATPTGIHWSGPDTPGYDVVREWLHDTWGESHSEEGDYRLWLAGECAREDCRRRTYGTRMAASLRKEDNLHPREEDEGWEIFLTSGPVEALLESASLPEPRMAGFGPRQWYPVWNPVSLSGAVPGMPARSAARQLGTSLHTSRCRPDDIYEEYFECRLGSIDLDLSGVPTVGKLRVDSAGRAMAIVVETPWQADESVATRHLELVRAALERIPGTNSWAHPFDLDVAKVRNGLIPARWRVMVTLSTRAAQRDIPESY